MRLVAESAEDEDALRAHWTSSPPPFRHELYLVFDVDVAERAVYEAEEIPVVEPDGIAYSACWRRLAEFESSARLVPTGLDQLIRRS